MSQFPDRLGFTPFRQRSPWIGGDLQTLRDTLRPQRFPPDRAEAYDAERCLASLQETDALSAADAGRQASRMPTREGVVPLAEMKRLARDAREKED